VIYNNRKGEKKMLEAVKATLEESLTKLKSERDMLDEQIATLETLAGDEVVATSKKRGRKPGTGKKRGPKPGKRGRKPGRPGRKPGPKAKSKKRGPKSRKAQSARMKAYWANWRKKNKSGKKKVKTTAKKAVSKLSDAAKQSIKDMAKAKAAAAA
jgi:hypothetical protein